MSLGMDSYEEEYFKHEKTRKELKEEQAKVIFLKKLLKKTKVKLSKTVALLKIIGDLDHYEMDGSFDDTCLSEDDHVTEVIEKFLKEIGEES